ncbi:MAG TPA: ATP-binding cassette domain-containing protein [Gaiellaceae bacterium]|jgi:ABC-type polysaccharide/polyol phosphate transport system ATPase subunit
MARSSPVKLDLPADVVLSVRGVSRGIGKPAPEVPAWLKRVLPKSGLAGKGGRGPDLDDADNPDDEFGPDFEEEERAALHELSFDLHAGEGLGIVGVDAGARTTLMRILIGALPPTTGEILVRGQVAPLLRRDLLRFCRTEEGRDAVMVVARMLHWPRSLIRSRWNEIEAFAAVEELKQSSVRKRAIAATARLLLASALHIDGTVYLVDNQIDQDAEFGIRCLDRIEQQKQQGAAVIQGAQRKVEDVARLCEHVLWFEDGRIAHSGRPIDVAVASERSKTETVHPLAMPVAASLAGGEESVVIGPDGSTIEIELHVLRKELELGFALRLVDDMGHEELYEQPERERIDSLGIYRLHIRVPPGGFSDGVYLATLLGEIAVVGSEPAPPRELASFDLVADSQPAAGDDIEPTFELLAQPESADPAPDAVEWSVGRARA